MFDMQEKNLILDEQEEQTTIDELSSEDEFSDSSEDSTIMSEDSGEEIEQQPTIDLSSLPKSNIDGKGFDDIDGLRTSKQGKIYVSNDILLAEVMKSKERDELTPKALKMFDLMIQNISSKKYYNNPDDKKDCWQSAYLDILMYWRGFDPEKTSNAFAYFTSLIINGLNKGWHKCAGKLKTSDIVSLDNNIHSL